MPFDIFKEWDLVVKPDIEDWCDAEKGHPPANHSISGFVVSEEINCCYLLEGWKNYYTQKRRKATDTFEENSYDMVIGEIEGMRGNYDCT